MNNVINMVNYYVEHKNADDSVVEYIKNKLESSDLTELIIIQIELLYTDPSDKLVSGLVNFITDKINNILTNINLYDLAITINHLKRENINLNNVINELTEINNSIFNKIKSKNLDDSLIDNETIDECVARLINVTQDNTFRINKFKSEINSINIWLNNLDNSYKKRIDNSDIRELLECYTKELVMIDRTDFNNLYIELLSKKIDKTLLERNLLETITNVMPELDLIYKENSNEKNGVYKLLDYYIDIIDDKIKHKINQLEYEEKLLLKEKINLICKDILENDNPDDDFKVLVINSYLRYF